MNDVLRPLLFKSLARGSVTPEKKGKRCHGESWRWEEEEGHSHPKSLPIVVEEEEEGDIGLDRMRRDIR